MWLSFKSKQVGKGRERENIKIIVPFLSNPTRNIKLKKNSKKIQRFKKYHYGFSSSQKKFEMDSKERIKIIITFRSNPTSNRKFQKNCKKIQKNVFFSSQNRFEKDEKM